MEFEDQPLAEARGRSTTMDKMVLLADKLFDEDPQIKHLLAEVLQQLQQQEDEIHRLQCVSQQRQRDIQRQEDEIHKLRGSWPPSGKRSPSKEHTTVRGSPGSKPRRRPFERRPPPPILTF